MDRENNDLKSVETEMQGEVQTNNTEIHRESMSDYCHSICEANGCGNVCCINESYHAGRHWCRTHV